jgi:glycosyltransferase involved in cell wall biosynthesis
MSATLTILYDGWPLVYEPNRPAALHLYALLACLPASIQAVLALPGELADPLALPASVQIEYKPTTDNPKARLSWEQRRLPELARRHGAQLVHLTHAHPALFNTPNTMISPTSPVSQRERPSSLPGRLRAAVSAGGMSQAAGVFWPQDLPLPDRRGRYHPLPPMVHPDFSPQAVNAISPPAAFTLPETFVLYHGPFDVTTLERLLSAWTWGAGALGQLYPLVLLGAQPIDKEEISRLARTFEVDDVLHTLPLIPLADIPFIYRACTALFHPAAPTPWGGAIRHALACGKPVVALESAVTDALVGPAAYLVPAGETRSLGAALITVIVETEVADRLASAAVKRSARWHDPSFGAALDAAYRQVLSER